MIVLLLIVFWNSFVIVGKCIVWLYDRCSSVFCVVCYWMVVLGENVFLVWLV